MANEHSPLAVDEWTIGEWTFDQSRGLIDNNGQTQDLDVKSSQVLCYLANNQHRIVGAQELRDQFWADHTNDISEPNRTIEQLLQLMNTPSNPPVIDIIDDTGYLLNLPAFQYNYQKVTTAQMRSKMLRKEQALVARSCSKRVEPPQPTSNNQQLLPRIIIVAVIIGAIYLSQL